MSYLQSEEGREDRDSVCPLQKLLLFSEVFRSLQGQ